MSTPLPTPFLSPVLTPFSPPADSNNHDPDFDHHDSPHHHHHRKRERVKSFVKHLASPFSSPSPPPAHLPQENGSPSNPTISLDPEPKRIPSVLHKRRSGSSVGGTMKNPPSPHSSPSPLPTPFPSPDVSRLSPNPNHSSPEIDHNGSPTRKRERVRSFVNNIRRTSSQLFKKDKKDHDPRKSALAALAAGSLSTPATTPSILRKFSHSKHRSAGSMTTTDTDYSETYYEFKVGSDKGSIGGSVGEPIIEVPTPISPTGVRPGDVPMYPSGETGEQEDIHREPEPEAYSQPTETASEKFDPLQFPLPPSRSSSPPPVAVAVEREVNQSPRQDPGKNDGEAPREVTVSQEDTISQENTVPQEDPVLEDPIPGEETVSHDNVASGENAPIRDDPVPHEDESSLPTLENTSPHDQDRPLAPTDPVSTNPEQVSQASPEPHSPTALVPGNHDKGIRDLCVPVLIPPMIFWPISNMRLSYVFTPLLTWWLSKGVLNYPSLYS